jgi:hypothetical protein
VNQADRLEQFPRGIEQLARLTGQRTGPFLFAGQDGVGHDRRPYGLAK